MKFSTSILTAAALVAASAAFAVPTLFGVSIPDDPDLAASVAAYLSEHSAIPASPDAPDAPYRIRFVALPTQSDVALDPEAGNSWLVNSNRLTDPGESPSRETLSRRAGQLALCAVAALWGMEPCPFPLCVLRPHPHPSNLDDMSRNYCPPCRDRINAIAASKGLQLLPAPAETAAP